MLDATANAVVVALFGLLIGALNQVAFTLAGEDRRIADSRKPGESYLDYMRRMAGERAEWGRNVMGTRPGSFKIAIASFYALIAIFVAVLIVSPVRMSWPAFLGGAFFGFLVLQWLFSRARAGRIQVKGHAPFDVLQ